MGSIFAKRSFAKANKDLTDSNKGDIENVLKNTKLILDYLESFKEWPDNMKVRKEAGWRMLQSGSLKIVCVKLAEALRTKSGYYDEPHEVLKDKPAVGDETKTKTPPITFVDAALELLTLLTAPECGADVCAKIVQNEALLKELVSNMDKDLKKPRCLSIIHNLAAYEAYLNDGYKTEAEKKGEKDDEKEKKPKGKMQGENLSIKHQDKILEKLDVLANSEHHAKPEKERKRVKLEATVALACVNATALKRDLLQFMVSHLCIALNKKDHRSNHCSATALERGVRHLLKGDKPLNKDSTGVTFDGDKSPKDRLIQYGIVSLLTKGALSEINEERTACIDSLWILCPEEDCKAHMTEDDNFRKLLSEMNKSKSNPWHEQAAFILRNLPVQVSGKPKSKAIKQEQNTASTTSYVMLSYQWDHQEIILNIKHKLEEKGIKTWMDVYDMSRYRNILSGMAKGVEECTVFLMGVSQKYQDSENCRLEAEFALQKKKTIIPIMLEKDFEPSDWLGLLQGKLLWYDFSEPHRGQFEEMINEIELRVGQVRKEALEKKTPTQAVQAIGAQSGKGVDMKGIAVERDVQTHLDAGAERSDMLRKVGLLGRNAVYPAPGGSGDVHIHYCCHMADQQRGVLEWTKGNQPEGRTIGSNRNRDMVCQQHEACRKFNYMRQTSSTSEYGFS